jgi:hypothetical protein
VFEGLGAIGYDHGYDAQKFYLGLALDPKYVEGFVEGCLERMGGDESEDEAIFRDLWEDEGERETVLTILQARLPRQEEGHRPLLLPQGRHSGLYQGSMFLQGRLRAVWAVGNLGDRG